MIEEKIEVLKTADEYIYKLVDVINKLVEYLRGGEEEEGMRYLSLVSDGLLWIIDTIEVTKDLYKDKINIEEINTKLNEVVEAVENEDYILIGDLFSYEILPMLENIHGKIRDIILN